MDDDGRSPQHEAKYTNSECLQALDHGTILQIAGPDVGVVESGEYTILRSSAYRR